MEQTDFSSNRIRHCNLSDLFKESIMGRRYDRLYSRFVELVNINPHDCVLELRWHTKACAFKLLPKAPAAVFSVDAGEAPSLCLPERVINPSHDAVHAFPLADGSMDVMTAFKVYNRLVNKRAFRSEAYRVLKPNGKLYVCELQSCRWRRKMRNALLRLWSFDLRLCDTKDMKAEFTGMGFRFVEEAPIGHMRMLVFQK